MYPLERLEGIRLPEGYEPLEDMLRIKSPGGRTRIDFKPENRSFSDMMAYFMAFFQDTLWNTRL